jgi:hypothetical protein
MTFSLKQTKLDVAKLLFVKVKISLFGGAGGNRTPVQKAYILGTTCLVDYLFNQLDANRQASSW